MVQFKNPKNLITLNHCATAMVYPHPPFHFDASVNKPSHFPSSDQFYQAGIYYFTTNYKNQAIGVKMLNTGSIDHPAIEVSIYTDQKLANSRQAEILAEIRWRFDLDADLHDFFASFADDAILQSTFSKWKGMRVQACQSLYEFIIITFVLQNTTVRRSVQMMENLFQAYGYKLAFDGQERSCFWTPAQLATVSEEDLRALKVGYRAKSILRLSQSFAQGLIDENTLRTYPKDLLRSELLKIYGIGPASVWYLMFEIFHHYDALETISPWEQKIYSQLLFQQELVEKEKIMAHVTDRWGKWRMLAMHYIFEDLFWQRKEGKIDWLEELIRL